MLNALAMAVSVAALALGISASGALAAGGSPVKSVVLVHGAFADGAGWEGVYEILKKDGYDVTVVQNPTITLTDDVAATKRAIAAVPGKVMLVGHSYGGAVISEAGTDPKVAGLVYITAFAPDAGESVSSLIANPPPGAAVPRSCRRWMGSCSWIARSSRKRSPRMCAPTWQRSWPPRRCPGAWRHWRARSPRRHGK